MKFVRKAGFLIFIFSFLITIASLFVNQYTITPAIVQQLNLKNNLNAELSIELQANYGISFKSKHTLLKHFKNSIEILNHKIEKKYSIQNEKQNELKQLFIDNDNKYEIDLLGNLYQDTSAVNEYKKKALGEYSKWMVGKQLNVEEFEQNIANSISEINAHIVENKGLDEYTIKQGSLQLVKMAGTGTATTHAYLFQFIFLLGIVGAFVYFIPMIWLQKPGVKNNHIYFDKLNNRGIWGIITGSLLILFYILLYWMPWYLAEWVNFVNPISLKLSGHEASNWFLYGFLYTTAILVMGTRFLIKYRHSNYHKIRTFSVMFFQLCFAFILANILSLLNLPEVDLKNIWPLDYSFFFEWRLNQYIEAGVIGYFMLFWGIALFIIGVPLLTYFFGKRWYCSWVCGCGGLAETAGDPFRQLSDKSLKAWRIERFSIYSVLVFAIVMTLFVLYTFFSGKSHLAGINSYTVRSVYGFLISSVFAGVVGTGFYPFFGNRVWCRFGCPLAAYLGIVQRFKSRFRITTNGSQCISCGNCSTYCEMGIDVRWYAQRSQNIVRSSCVGCGICAAVCPRGVLRLENGPEKERINSAIF